MKPIITSQIESTFGREAIRWILDSLGGLSPMGREEKCLRHTRVLLQCVSSNIIDDSVVSTGEPG